MLLGEDVDKEQNRLQGMCGVCVCMYICIYVSMCLFVCLFVCVCVCVILKDYPREKEIFFPVIEALLYRHGSYVIGDV